MTPDFVPVEERERIRERLLERARADPGIVAAALIGSGARGDEDRWSDIDLTFGVAAPTTVEAILDRWTGEIEREFAAVRLFDVTYRSTRYRVFLFPGSLQVDLSFTPAREFAALGPAFRLLYGTAAPPAPSEPIDRRERAGRAIHHALRARISLERDRPLQADHWCRAVRDEALVLACLRRDLEPSNGRGFDRLPPDLVERAEDAMARSLEPEELRRALRASVGLLLDESGGTLETFGAPVVKALRGFGDPSSTVL